MVAGQVEFQDVELGFAGQLCKVLPILLVVSSHDRPDYDLVRVVFLQLIGSFHPIPAFLLRNELDVGERGLSSQDVVGSFEDTRCYVDDFVFVEDEGFGDCESPSHFEGSSDHGVGSGWRSRGQSVWVVEVHSCHLGGDVHEVDLGEKVGEFGSISEVDSVFLSDGFVEEPAGHFSIIDRIY